MHRKKEIAYRLWFAIFIVCSTLSSCKPSLFDVLTHGDVGYWARTWGVGVISFSKNDSVCADLYGDLSPETWLWSHRYKFKIKKNSINYAQLRYDGSGGDWWGHMDLVLSYSRNRLKLVHSRDYFTGIGYVTYYRRIKNKELKMRRDGTYIDIDSIYGHKITVIMASPEEKQKAREERKRKQKQMNDTINYK